MLSKYQYYTGIIFKAYTYGTGDYIVTGGRYDRLLEQFGKSAPAVGFAIVVDRRLMALASQGISLPVNETNTMILFDVSARVPAIRLAKHFRSHSFSVQFQRKHKTPSLEDYLKTAAESGLSNVLYVAGDGLAVQAFNVKTGQCDQIPMSEYLGSEE